MKISGRIVDINQHKIYAGEVEVLGGVIADISAREDVEDQYLLPGFIDAHVHIESSMLVPAEFARMAVVHGTVATISDPHEIGNVLGIDGVRYMIENGRQVPFKFYFGAPSCVPATSFETAGASIDATDVEKLLRQKEIHYLAEMMNWPGVLFKDPVVEKKLELARQYKKPIDGHAPGLRGKQAEEYVRAGITTDHECFTAEEALEKLQYGMKIIIREGSAAKNFEALCDLIRQYPDSMMFCSDDKHPDSLEEGHIDKLVKRAVAKGIDLFKVLKVACINPILHYHMEVGMLRKGDAADFIVVKDLKEFEVSQTFIGGQEVAKKGVTRIKRVKASIENNFSVQQKQSKDFAIAGQQQPVRVIEALDGQLITHELTLLPKIEHGFLVSDVQRDLLKITVVNRYQDAKPALGFIRNFNLKAGAIASSVAHDSHNIIAVGVDDESIAKAVNMVIRAKGGIAAVDQSRSMLIELPVAGLMSTEDGYEVARQYKAIDQMAKEMGSTLGSPFMTLSFMALLVIPSLKLSDKGLFNGEKFEFRELFI